MPGSLDQKPVYVLALDEDDFTVLCHIALFIRSPGEIPLPLTDHGRRILHLTHLAYDRVHHPKRVHPCPHCRPGAVYAPPERSSR